MTKAVIFDFNVVIVDDFVLQKQTWNTIFQKLGKNEISDSELRAIRGIPTKDVIRNLINKNLSDDEISQISKEKEDEVRHIFNTSPLFKINLGLERFLDEIVDAGLLLNIATSTSKDLFKFSFDKLCLNKWFDFEKLLYKDGTHKGKPAPDPYLISARKIGAEPKNCIVFEDAISGIQSAYAAGVKGIVAVNDKETLKNLLKHPGVIKGIENFENITFKDIL